MEDQKFSFSGTFEKAKEYIETRIELLKLKTIAQSSKLIGALILDISKVILVLFIIFFLSLALGFYFGELLGSYSLGFLVTGGVFFLILLLIRAFEPNLEKIFMNVAISRFLQKLNEDDDENAAQEVQDKTSEDNFHATEQEVFNEELKKDENK